MTCIKLHLGYKCSTCYSPSQVQVMVMCDCGSVAMLSDPWNHVFLFLWWVYYYYVFGVARWKLVLMFWSMFLCTFSCYTGHFCVELFPHQPTPIQPGVINALAFSRSGSYLVAAVAQEHRFGRWWKVKGVRNGVAIISLPRQCAESMTSIWWQYQFVIWMQAIVTDGSCFFLLLTYRDC